MQINALAISWKYNPLSMERVFAALLFAARVNHSTADNPFPRRRLPVHVGPMLLKYTRGLCISVHKVYVMANLPLKWLFPRVSRVDKREKIASGSDFCRRGH